MNFPIVEGICSVVLTSLNLSRDSSGAYSSFE